MSGRKSNVINNNNGFTLVELMIVAPIIILMIGAFISLIITMTGDIISTRGGSSLAYNIQDALNRIEQDVKLSGAYLATNNVSIVSPQGYDDGAATFHNATTNTAIGPMLILNSYTTTSNPVLSTRKLVYENTPNTCGSNQEIDNQPLMMNIIYFVKNNTLWRRVIANTGYDSIGCSVPWQQPSCSPGVTGTICKTSDIRLIDGVSSVNGFIINYYSSLNPDVEVIAASNGSLSDTDRIFSLQTAKSAKITINATKTFAGRDVVQTGSIIVTSQNSDTSI